AVDGPYTGNWWAVWALPAVVPLLKWDVRAVDGQRGQSTLIGKSGARKETISSFLILGSITAEQKAITNSKAMYRHQSDVVGGRWLFHHDSNWAICIFGFAPDGPAVRAAVIVHDSVTADLFERARRLGATRRTWLSHGLLRCRFYAVPNLWGRPVTCAGAMDER